jgi:HK97 family phage portal protein
MGLLTRLIDAIRPKAATLSPVDGNHGWITLGRYGNDGDLDTFDWQRDINRKVDGPLSNPTVFACMTLIAGDCGKMRAKLMEQGADGIWVETKSPAFSPVLRKPNDYQTWQKFIESWLFSKLSRGNFYGLKDRDNRGVVVAIHPLDPERCHPLVSDSGEVFYELLADDLAKVPEGERIVVPASEIIHDRMWCLFHELVGLSPLFAAALAADQGLRIMLQSRTFFANASRPSGTLVSPGFLTEEQAELYKKRWDANYGPGKNGKTAILGNGLEYKPIHATATDSQLVEQLKMSAEMICAAFHVPGWKVGVGTRPAYQNANIEQQIYYNDCLQPLIEAIESVLDEGLGLTGTYRTELDLDGLLRMDEGALTDVLVKQAGAGLAKINELRRRLNLGPVTGGDTPYLQQQNYSLEALSKRDKSEDPFGKAQPAAPSAPPSDPPADDEEKAALIFARLTKSAFELETAELACG